MNVCHEDIIMCYKYYTLGLLASTRNQKSI